MTTAARPPEHPATEHPAVEHLAIEQLAIEHLEGFVTALAAAGVVPGLNKRADFLRGVALVRPAAPAELYWAARVTLVSAREEVAPFDRVFAAWFGDAPVTLAPPARRPAPPRVLPSRRRRLLAGPKGGSEGRRQGAGHEASVEETSSTCAFPPTSTEKRRLLAETEAALARALPTRRALRHRPARRGDQLDLRRVLRAAGRNGGDVVRLQWRRRPRRPRRVLVLVDVSGSLRQSSGDALRFAHALVRAVPRAEVYTFGTRLTRVTRQLAARDVDAALDGLAGVVLDVNGGTRIGAALEEFLADARRTAAARDALVLIVSDGLERGEPGGDGLGRETPGPPVAPGRVVVAAGLRPQLPAGHPGHGGGARRPGRPRRRARPGLGHRRRAPAGHGRAARRRSVGHKMTKSRPEMMTEGPIAVVSPPRSWG